MHDVNKLHLLYMLYEQPRSAQELATAHRIATKATPKPNHLNSLLDDELIARRADGMYEITEAGANAVRADKISREGVTPPRRINVMAAGVYRTGDGDTGVTMRPGSDTAFKLPSRGL